MIPRPEEKVSVPFCVNENVFSFLGIHEPGRWPLTISKRSDRLLLIGNVKRTLPEN